MMPFLAGGLADLLVRPHRSPRDRAAAIWRPGRHGARLRPPARHHTATSSPTTSCSMRTDNAIITDFGIATAQRGSTRA